MTRLARDGWTVAMAIADFERTGLLIEEVRFRKGVQLFRLPRIGEMASGPNGGRGQALYDIGHLQLLHADFIRWRDRLG